MKKLLTLTSILLVTIFSLTLMACSTYGKVEKALNAIGYTAIETSNDEAEDMEQESDVAITVHLLSNEDSLSLTEAYKLNTIIVLEFKATEDMKTFYEDSDTLKGLLSDIQEDGSAEEFYNALVEKGYANGNCLVVSINPLVFEEVTTAIKNA